MPPVIPFRPLSRRSASTGALGAVLIWAAMALALPAGAVAQAKASDTSPSALKKLSLDQLMDIEVTSVSRRPEKLAQAPASIQVITAEDIHRSGATSLPEALRLASNLETARIDARQWAITARGFNNVFADKMLVLIDGRTVYTPLYAGVYWDVQDTMLEDIDRIEVISGPGSTQWGANAVNGVINLTTRSARDTHGGVITALAGTEIRDGAAVRYGAQLAPGWHGRVYAKSTSRDDSVRSNGQSGEDGWDFRQAGFRVDGDLAGGGELTLQGDLYAGSASRGPQDDSHFNGRNLLGRWTLRSGPERELRVQVYYDHTHRDIPGSFIQTLDTYDFDLQHRFPIGSRHDVVWGLGYRVVDDDIVNTPANAFLPPQVTRDYYSAFFQDELTFAEDRVRLTFGTKLEHNDYTGYEIEPSVRASWTVTPAQNLWAAVSRAVRVPSRIDRDLYSPATPPYRIAGGPNVVSEKLVAYEAGYRVQAGPRVALSVSAFYHDYRDLRSLEPLNPPRAFPVVINSGLVGHSTGAELGAEWLVLPAWRLRAGYTELRVESRPQKGLPDRPGNGRNIANDPQRQGLLRSMWDIGPHLTLDATLRAVGRIATQSVPGYTELDLNLGWRPVPAWEFSLVGQNLLNRDHPEFNPPGARRELQRSIHGRLTWRF